MPKLHLKSILPVATLITYTALSLGSAKQQDAPPPNPTKDTRNHQSPAKQPKPLPFIPQFATGYEPNEFHPNNPNEISWMTFDNTSPLPNTIPWFMSIAYGSPGDINDRRAQLSPDPAPTKNNPNNTVLHLWLQNATIETGFNNHTKGRIQTGFSGQLVDATEIYSKQRMFIHEDLNLIHSYPASADQWWRGIPFYDFWAGADWEGHPNPSNIGLLLIPSQNNFYLQAINRAMPELDIIWDYTNITTPIPVGQWFSIEVAYKMGDANNGRIVVAITPESTNIRTVLLNITNITYDPDADLPGATGPVSVTHWNPQKLYASDNTIHYIRDNGGTAQFYFDDFEFSGQWPNNFPEPLTP